MKQEQVGQAPVEVIIDRLVNQFHHSVESVAQDPKKYSEMLGLLSKINSRFSPVIINTRHPEALVLANVVAGIYAPLIHAFSNSILRNMQTGALSSTVVAPPRDAIPVANSLRAQAELQGFTLKIFEPPINRNTAGVANNQKDSFVGRSPFLDRLFDQTLAAMNKPNAVTEVETGIYGTTSLIMARAFKSRDLSHYYPVKFYGLGPNISYVHAVLSGGKEWIAENAENSGLVNRNQIADLMVLLDTMEELGMEKFYRSVEALEVGQDGLIKPVVVPVSEEELEIATVTNQVVINTASQYADLTISEVRNIIEDVPKLVEYSKGGLPFTLTEAIPSMSSKDDHFNSIRASGLFSYPLLQL